MTRVPRVPLVQWRGQMLVPVRRQDGTVGLTTRRAAASGRRAGTLGWVSEGEWVRLRSEQSALLDPEYRGA